MNCLLCDRQIPQQIKFYQPFLLQAPQDFLCQKCQVQFEKIPEKHCPRCYKADCDGICQDCQEWEKQGIIIQHQAIFRYNQAMKDFFSQYKFVGDYRLYHIFTKYFTNLDKNATIVPIPLSPERLQERGFNQVSAFLGQAKFADLLEKRDTVKQSSLNRVERLASQNPFSIKANVQIPKKILLVDDIYTTGRTLQHAVETLKSAGATEVSTFSLCR